MPRRWLRHLQRPPSPAWHTVGRPRRWHAHGANDQRRTLCTPRRAWCSDRLALDCRRRAGTRRLRHGRDPRRSRGLPWPDRQIVTYMNHELEPGQGIVRRHGQDGAFVSRLVMGPVTGAVERGRDLIEEVRYWDYQSSGYSHAPVAPAAPPKVTRPPSAVSARDTWPLPVRCSTR